MSRRPADLSLDELAAAARAVATRYTLDLVVLFGSTARRDPALVPEDLDVAVRAPAGAPVPDVGLIAHAFAATLDTPDVDVVDLRRADPLLLMLVARDGVPLHQAEPSTFAEFWSLAHRRYWDAAMFRDAERETIRDFVRARAPAHGDAS